MDGDEGEGSVPEEGAEEVYAMLEASVDGVLSQNDEARAAHRALRDRGFSESEAREEIARVLLAVMMHVGRRSERIEAAGGGAALRREAFQRLAGGETADDIFG